MKIREKIGKYWLAGAIILAASSLTDGLLRLFMDYTSSLPAQEWRYGPIFLRIPEQSWWIIVIVIVAITSLIALPWLFGRLIEVLHTEFVVKKKPE